jgi:hypothetical protein
VISAVSELARCDSVKEARPGADNQRVATYRRSPRWILYPFVAIGFAVALSGLGAGPGHLHGTGGSILFVIIVLGAFLGPLALALWNRGMGVHVSDAGIVSVGLSDAHVIRWQDIDRFVVDPYRVTRVCVYAQRRDGSRVALYALQGRSWQRKSVERLCAALQEEQRTRAPAAAAAAFSPLSVPFGWRGRVDRIEKREQATRP